MMILYQFIRLTIIRAVVVFRVKVFFVEDRDIKSKKTGKEFHLITMDITDNEDSISAKMFVTKRKMTSRLTSFFKLKKGVKGGGIYIVARGKAQFDQYAGETIVMINDIAEIENRLFVWMRHRKNV